jgi:hypothetical protein
LKNKSHALYGKVTLGKVFKTKCVFMFMLLIHKIIEEICNLDYAIGTNRWKASAKTAQKAGMTYSL